MKKFAKEKQINELGANSVINFQKNRNYFKLLWVCCLCHEKC